MRHTGSRLWWGALGALGVLTVGSGCAGSAPPPRAALQAPKLERVPVARVEQARDRQVAVAGIEGTLSEYEVRTTMEKRMDELAECQVARMNEVPLLMGAIEVAIHVERDGNVSRATARRSSIGDLVTERCILDVVRETRFPRPRGGEADVSWSMGIDPRGRRPDQLAAERVKGRVARRLPKLRETCAYDGGPVDVTAYVGRSGKVLAVGAAAAEPAADELFDCISEDVKTWRMPKGKRVAKVSFQLP